MYATNHFETAFLNAMRGIQLTAPSAFYVALYISNPGESGFGTEITYQGYARQPVGFTVPAWDVALKATAIKNDLEITFPTSPTDAGTITHLGIMDSVVGGNMWAYGEAREGLIVNADEAPVILTQELIYYSTGNLSELYKSIMLNVLRCQSVPGFVPCLALFNGDPNSGGAELSGDNYARAPLEFSAPTEADSGQMQTQNVAAVSFNRPTTPWGTWNYTAIYDSLSSGKPMWIVDKTPSKELKKGYMPRVAAGDVKVAIN